MKTTIRGLLLATAVVASIPVWIHHDVMGLHPGFLFILSAVVLISITFLVEECFSKSDCRNCQGSGKEVIEYKDDDLTGGNLFPYKSGPCPDCKGTGTNPEYKL